MVKKRGIELKVGDTLWGGNVTIISAEIFPQYGNGVMPLDENAYVLIKYNGWDDSLHCTIVMGNDVFIVNDPIK